jgi:hypothetical protein
LKVAFLWSAFRQLLGLEMACGMDSLPLKVTSLKSALHLLGSEKEIDTRFSLLKVAFLGRASRQRLDLEMESDTRFSH